VTPLGRGGRLYRTLISVKAHRNGPLSVNARISGPIDARREDNVSDLIYLALGVAVLLVFAGYAVLLRRA
jgi:hypothetical protein